MKTDIEYVIEQLIHNDLFTFDSLLKSFKESLPLITDLEKKISQVEKKENYDLIIQYILKQSERDKKEIFEEICKLHRTPFLTHKQSLSRIVIINEEVFLHILKNDKRFFLKGPLQTSVDVIEEQLDRYLGTFYPNCFGKKKKIRKKEIYDALINLEDISNPHLITTTKLHPGTGAGKRRRKRYCLTDDGLYEAIPFISLAIRDQLENFRYQI